MKCAYAGTNPTLTLTATKISSHQSSVIRIRSTALTDYYLLITVNLIIACACSLLVVTPVLAHDNAPLAPHDLWHAWNPDPLILFGLGLTAWLYGQGIVALWRRAGVSRGVTLGQASAFYGGLLTLFVALMSPVDALSGVLFSAHMGQHLLLIVVAAPLLVLGAPPLALLWAIPQRSRRPLAGWWHRQSGLPWGWRVLTQPVTVWLLHTLALWLWHAPVLYQAALAAEIVHVLEHASFLGTALLFWWVVLQPGDKGYLRYGVGMILAFATALQSGLLGALMTFATTPWYPGYRATTAAWGLTLLEDQQLAGVIMWVPAGVVYLGVTLMLLGVWLHRMERSETTPY